MPARRSGRSLRLLALVVLGLRYRARSVSQLMAMGLEHLRVSAAAFFAYNPPSSFYETCAESGYPPKRLAAKRRPGLLL